MQIFDSLDISSSGLSVQRRKLTAIASNLANVDTTRTDEGGPYKRRRIVMLEAPKMSKFTTMLTDERNRLRRTETRHRPEGESRPGVFMVGSGVLSQEVREEPVKPRMVYDPNHPDAREDGMVLYPDINVITEMVDMIAARDDPETPHEMILSRVQQMVRERPEDAAKLIRTMLVEDAT